MELVSIPVHEIVPNPEQPRKQFDETALHNLRRSIAMTGQQNPIAVRAISEKEQASSGAKYLLIDGERRWRAASMEGSGIPTLEAIVRNIPDDELYLKSCVFNFGREGHTPYEEILMVHNLATQLHMTQNAIATALGKSQPWVGQRHLAWQRLDARVMTKLKEDKLPISVATTLSKLRPDAQVIEMNKYLRGGTVTDVKVAVREATDRGEVQGGVRKPDAYDDREYIRVSVKKFHDRLRRLDTMGVERIRAVTESLNDTQRAEMIADLTSTGEKIISLINTLNQKKQKSIITTRRPQCNHRGLLIQR